MKRTIKDFTLELIDDPLQAHIVAWESAARALRNEDVKPILAHMMAELKKISVAKTSLDLPSLLKTFQLLFEALDTAAKIIQDNETLTLSKHHGVMVKAAITAGWIISPTLQPDDVDHMQPWLVNWIAIQVGTLYNEATDIPKN